MKKGASLLVVDYQQIGARKFGYLFFGSMVPFLGEMADPKRARADFSANGVKARVQIQSVRSKPRFASIVRQADFWSLKSPQTLDAMRVYPHGI